MKRFACVACAVLLVLAAGLLTFYFVKRNQLQAEWPDGLYFIQGDVAFESGGSFQAACLAVGKNSLEGLQQNTTKLSLIDAQGKRFPAKYSVYATAAYPRFTLVTMNFSMDEAAPEAEFNRIEIAEKGRGEKQIQKVGKICAKNVEFEENAFLFDSSMYLRSSSFCEEITYFAWNNTGNDLMITGIDMLSDNHPMLKDIRVGVRAEESDPDAVALQAIGDGVAVGSKEGLLIVLTYDFSALDAPYFLYDTPQISYTQKAENNQKSGLCVPTNAIANEGLCNIPKLAGDDASMTAIKQYIREAREQ